MKASRFSCAYTIILASEFTAVAWSHATKQQREIDYYTNSREEYVQ